MKLADLLLSVLDADGVRPQAALLSGKTQALPDFSPGQQLSAEIKARLGASKFLVSLQGQTFQMRLPGHFKTGDTATLIYIGQGRHPVFSLSSPVSAQSARVQLTGDARLIDALRHLPLPDQAGTEAPARLAPALAEALLAKPEAVLDTATLGQELQKRIEKGGLFYERHLADWAQGQYSLEDLKTEPQGHVSRNGSTAAQASAAHSDVAPNIPRAPETALPVVRNHVLLAHPEARTEAERMSPIQTSLTHASASDLPDASRPDADPGGALARLVQTQLQTLESGQIVWHGQLWPGQDMEWKIHADANGSQVQAATPTWFSQLTLILPHLGEVRARLQLSGNAISLHLEVEEGSKEYFHDHQPLEIQLAAAGLTLQGIGIHAAKS